MQTIGFSTGAVAFGDFESAIQILSHFDVNAIELSALRFKELGPLVAATTNLDLRRYKHIAFHAPSRFEDGDEPLVIQKLLQVVERGWLIIVHPDVLVDWAKWKPLEKRLCFENMDRRKPIARTAAELEAVFRYFPSANLCFDVGHAHQIDRTMTEARLILQRFRGRVRQMHVSEVNTASEHVPVSLALKMAVQKIIDLIDDQTPVIIESVVSQNGLQRELNNVIKTFEQSLCTLSVPD